MEAKLELGSLPKLDTRSGLAHPVQPIALDQAVQSVPKLPAEIKNLLQNTRSQEAIREIQMKEVAEKRATVRAQSLRKRAAQDPTDDPATYSTMTKLKEVINGLYLETTTEFDLTVTDCNTFTYTTKGEIEMNTQTRVYLAAMIATAREDIASASASAAEAESEIGKLQEQLAALRSQCKESLDAMAKIIDVTEKDYGVANHINGKVECTDTPALAASFMQCMVQSDASHFQQSFHLTHEGKMVTFASKAAYQAMQAAARVAMKEDPAATGVGDPTKDEPTNVPDGSPTPEEIHAEYSSTEWMQNLDPLEVPHHCGPIGDKVKIPAEKCKTLKDAIGQMVGEIGFVLTETKQRSATEEARCQHQEGVLDGQITELNEQLRLANIMLTKATVSLNMNSDELRLRVEEFVDARDSLVDRIKTCNEKFIKLHEEKCGLVTIRQELYKIVGGNPYIRDCEVSDWELGHCTTTCGAGSQMNTRVVDVKPQYGAECPPLSEQISCNEEVPCPVDCVYAQDWSEWSSCSKDCDGGITTRIRQIGLHGEHGGVPCGAEEETLQCNTQKCDADCTIGQWSEWSECSKICGGGVQTRQKPIAEEAIGNGVCPEQHEEDPMAFPTVGARAERHACNEHPCFPNLACRSKIDVVLVDDASGSVGSVGWQQTKDFSVMLLDHLHLGEDDAHAGVVEFSETANIVSAMSDKMDEIKPKVEAMPWQGSLTMTGQAIDTAISVLQMGGRAEAIQIIMVVTDGSPTSRWGARGAAARALQIDGLRLVFVGVGENADHEEMLRLASWPHDQNVLYVAEYANLEARLGDFLATMCPQEGCSEKIEDNGRSYAGCQSHGRSGTECQVWTVDTPHYHHYEHYFPNGGLGDHNFCRNPDGDMTIWCWSTDTSVNGGRGWEYCDPRDTEEIPEDMMEYYEH